jgi:hypothetical protein
MTSLILKRASASRPDGQWKDEDYDVFADGKVVGRIYEDAHLSTPPELGWFLVYHQQEGQGRCDGGAFSSPRGLVYTD